MATLLGLPIIGTKNDFRRSSWVIRELTKLNKGDRILDAGAGELRFKKFCEHLKYTSQDFAQYDGHGNKSGLQTSNWDNSKLDIVSDITQIPLENDYFDAVLCTEVFEHIPEPDLALKEFGRLLKNGGTLLITAPFSSVTHFAPYHFAGYSRYWWEYHLKKHGFVIDLIESNGTWYEFIAQELLRTRSVSWKYSSKILGLISYLAILPLLFLFSIMSILDKSKSSELLCFGYLVRAKKISN